MTDAERLLLLLTADTLLLALATPELPDTTRLRAARHALDVEAHQAARQTLTMADNGQVTALTPEPHDAAMDRFGEALAAHRRTR